MTDLIKRKLVMDYYPETGYIVTDDNYCGAPDSHCPMGSGHTEVDAIISYWEQVAERLT